MKKKNFANLCAAFFKQRDNQIRRKHQKRKVVTALKQEEKTRPHNERRAKKRSQKHYTHAGFLAVFFKKIGFERTPAV